MYKRFFGAYDKPLFLSRELALQPAAYEIRRRKWCGCLRRDHVCKLHIHIDLLGYSVGSAPIVSYHYGAGNRDELKNMFKKSTSLIAIWGILLVLLAHAIAGPLTKIFVGYDAELFALTKHGFLIYSFTYLINGFNIYGSSFFTALNNGLISALIHSCGHLCSSYPPSCCCH